MTAPFRVPPAGRRSNSPPADALGDLDDIAPTDPFADLQDIAKPRPLSSARILARNDAGRLRDAAEAGPGPWDQVKAGARSAYEGIRHPLSTLKGMASHAVEDLGTVASAMNAGMGQPSDLTPARAGEVPRAIMNTAANALLPIAPAAGPVLRSAINATLGAVNDPDQPLRGASAALLMGEALHQAPNVIPARVRPPRVRLDEVSEPIRNAAFWQTIDDGARAQTVRGAESRVAGYEPTTTPLRSLTRNPRKPGGFTAGADPFADLGDVAPALPRQKPVDVVRPYDDVATIADENAANLDTAQQAAAGELRAKVDAERTRIGARDAQVDEFWRSIDGAQEETTRQAALRALTGVRRRAGGEAAPDALPISREALNPPAVEPTPVESAAQGPLPSYPDGFAMGDAEGRIPEYTAPRPKGSDPATLPEGVTPETIALAESVKPNPFRKHSTDALADTALNLQHAIEQAQLNVAMDGEASMSMNESTGESISDQTPLYLNKGLTLRRSVNAMAKLEREFALRGLTGNDLADVIAGARERRMEREGKAQDFALAMEIGTDPFADLGDIATPPATPAAATPDPLSQLAPLPVGVPRPAQSLLNPTGFAEELRPHIAEAEATLKAAGVTKMRVSLDEQRAQAEPLRRSLAADLGMSVLDMDPQKAGRLTGAEIVALKEAAGRSMDEITALAKQLADPSLIPADRQGVASLLDNARAARDGLLERVVTASSQKGRDLAFLRQVAQRTLDPDVWMVNAKRALGDRPLTDEIVVSLNKLVREAADACAGGSS